MNDLSSLLPASVQAACRTPFTILAVDDKPDNLFTLQALLGKLAGCVVLEADSGEGALARVIETRVDLVLLDIQMPGMDGFETARHLKMTARTRDIPILFLTAVFKAEEFVRRGYAEGAIDYLTKPIDNNQLLNRIALYRSLHEREAALQAALDALQRSSEARFLQRQAELLRNTSQNVPGMIYQYQMFADGRSCFPYASDGIRDIYELDPAAVHDDASPVFSRLHVDDVEQVSRSIGHSAQHLTPWNLEYRVCLPGKGLRWLQGQAQPERLPDQSVLWHGFIADISARKEAEARLQLAANVFSHAREGIMITDVAGTIIEVNEAFSRITGYPRDEAIGQNPRLLNSGRQPAEYYAVMWRQLAEQGYWTGEVWNRRKSGEVYAEMLTISAVSNAAGQTQHYVGLFSDITPLKTQQQQLERIAHYDALTQLPNRVLLADRLQQAMMQSARRKQLLAVVYLDLDGFKAVNDQHGHDAGDELLIALAQRMQEALREGDTLARIGGDEFVALLPDLAAAPDCDGVLARLLQAAADPVPLGEQRLQVSASIGVALFPRDGADAEQLLRHADQAMYQAKEQGKNRCHWFADAPAGGCW